MNWFKKKLEIKLLDARIKEVHWLLSHLKSTGYPFVEIRQDILEKRIDELNKLKEK